MEIYSIHPETGAYLGTSQADESPLEPGEFLVPAHAVTIAPPAVAAGERARWDGSSWVVEQEPAANAPETPMATPQEIERASILCNIAALEAQQARPLREVLLAQLAGQQPPQFSAAKLADIETQIAAQRALLAAL